MTRRARVATRGPTTYEILRERENRILGLLEARIDSFDEEASRLTFELCETAVARAAIDRYREELAAKARIAEARRTIEFPAEEGIRGAIVAVLRRFPQGARASEITALIDRWPGTSVRPHFTRLERAGLLWHRDGLWGLVEAQSIAPGAGERAA